MSTCSWKVDNLSLWITFLKALYKLWIERPSSSLRIRGDEWSIKIFNCSPNFTFARFAHKI